MVFVRRAATVALLTFASALAGFGVHGFLPANYVVESRSMVGSVVGLVASLLSLVLSLLIWTSHGLFTTQQSQLQAIGRSIIQLDFALTGYGSEVLGAAPCCTIMLRGYGRACGRTDWPLAAPSITPPCPRTFWECATFSYHSTLQTTNKNALLRT